MGTRGVTIKIQLGASAVEALRRDVVGSGGFQSLLRGLQKSLTADRELTLSLDDVGRIARYVNDYGPGGFQGRLDEVLTVLRQLATSLSGLIKT